MQVPIKSSSTALPNPPEAGWASIEEFAQWYMNSGTPMAVPWDAEVIVSDDATAICMFRKAPYQVELYLVYPRAVVPEHQHPGVETLIVVLGGGRRGSCAENGLSDVWGASVAKTEAGQTHGGGQFGSSPNGYAMLAFEKWSEGIPITSAAVRWRGETAGPKQDALINKHHPGAVVIPGFADVTRRRAEAVL